MSSYDRGPHQRGRAAWVPKRTPKPATSLRGKIESKQFWVGAGIAFAFYFLPYAIKQMPPAIAWGGSALGICIAVLPWIPSPPKSKAVIALIVTALVAIAAGFIGPSITSSDEILPGFAHGTMISMEDNTNVGRKFVWKARDPEGAEVALYQSPNNDFRFVVTDTNGEEQPLDIPLGSKGIPLRKFIYLICEVGTASNHAYLRALADGKEVVRRDLPFPLSLGSRQWNHFEFGGGASFLFAETGVSSTTLSQKEIDAQTDNVRRYYGQ